MNSVRNFVACLSLLALVVSVAGCGHTWRGLIKDIGENLRTVGATLENAGEGMQDEEEQDTEWENP